MKNITVLLVDDEEIILHYLKRSIRNEGYEIITAPSGKEAIEIIKEKDIAVIVTDVTMPGMRGIELLKHLKEHSPDTFRIVLTGNTDTQSAVDAINKGEAHRFINKPWDDDILKQTIREGIDRYTLVSKIKELNALVLRQRDELKKMNALLEDKVRERRAKSGGNKEPTVRSYVKIIETLSHAVNGKASHADNQPMRVAGLSATIAGNMGLPSKDIEDIRVAGLLHDLENAGIRNVMKDDVEEMKEHSSGGSGILESIEYIRNVLPIIIHHHERFDGKDYRGILREDEIPLGARIMAVSDAYDAMTSHSSFRSALSHEEALERIKAESGFYFDPAVVDIFLKTVG